MPPSDRYEWNQTDVEYAREKTIGRLFSEQVARTPDAIAVECAGQRLTYRQLDIRTNQLAHYLQSAGVGPDTAVGISIERSNDMLIAMLAVLKAGGAYLPLDPHYPSARIAMVVEDSAISILLTTDRNRGNLPASKARIISLDGESKAIAAESTSPVKSNATPGDLAYVIYTSGSTGKPKGVMVENRNAINFFTGMDRVIGSEPGVWLALTSFSFDISVLELLWTLTRGFHVIIHPDGSTDTIPGEIQRHGVTHLQSTPSLARLFATDHQSLASLGSLRKLLLGGEALPASLIQALRQSYKGEIFNMYGPTETTVWSTTYRIQELRSSIPIGKPIANTQVHVFDSQLRPVALGEAGDLYIGGDGVVRGYWNRPELTAERFIPDPYRNGGRLYRTGDIARVLPDGNLEFLGRADFQVKIRGFRIELGEIEAALEQQACVRQAVVVASEESSGNKSLSAYIVPRPGETPAANGLRAALESSLPDYMVPSHFVFLESLPLTANGKVDRKSLPSAAVPPVGAGPVDDAPQSELEQMIAQAWAEALGAASIRRSDNFFDLGGHSLTALQIAFKLRQLFNVEFSLQAFMETPVLSAQGKYLEEKLLEQADASLVDELIGEMEQERKP